MKTIYKKHSIKILIGIALATGIVGTSVASYDWKTLGAGAWGKVTNGIAYVSGRVGIGTDDPQYNLDVAGDINFTGDIYKSGSIYKGGHFQESGTGGNIQYSGGNVGIGVTDPQSALDVAGNIEVDGGVKLGNITDGCSAGAEGSIRYNGSALEICLDGEVVAGGGNLPVCSNGQILVYNTSISGWECTDNAGTASFAGYGDIPACKQILDSGQSSGDGVYSFDPDGPTGPSPAYDVYCDMTTDGGGWTYTTRINSNRGAGGNLFTVPNLTYYNTGRIDDNQNSSIGILDEWADTEMMITLDTPSPVTADNLNKLVFFRYSPTNIMFNNGPVPCAGIDLPEYKTFATDTWKDVTYSNSCGNSTMYLGAPAGYLVLFHSGTANSVYWGAGIGGNNTWAHDAWIYVR